MSQATLTLRAREWVEIKSPAEILETLDPNGTLDGLPFMPEMLELCGRRVQVARVASKTCVEYPGHYRMNEFRNNDVVVLDAPRCSGAAHGGCQRLCVFFWKTAWLKKSSKTDEGRSPQVKPSDMERLGAALKTQSEDGRYICQSTAMYTATLPMGRAQVLKKIFEDVRSGSKTVPQMARAVWIPLWRYLTRYKFLRKRPTGTLEKTPIFHLNLQPGELVRVKSSEEIEKTVDAKGCNRGLLFHSAMCNYIGGEYRVSSRLDRMISEATGKMRKVDSTVMLEGTHCPCTNHVGGCPRSDLIYWREIWLERTAK